jgi:ribose transport system substrate-binding protein
VAAAAGAAAKVLGISFHIADSKLGAGVGYITAMDTALAAHPSAIIVHGIDCSNIVAPLRQAAAAHIPVLGVEDLPCAGNNPAMAGPMKYTSSEGSGTAYFNAWGKTSADAIIDLTGGKAQVLNTTGPLPLYVAIDDGFTSELKKCPGCKIVGGFKFVSADETPGGAYVQELRADILKFSNANAVMTPVDPAAQFGAPVVHKANPKTANVGGSGEIPDIDLIRQGIMTAATGAHDGAWMGWAAMDEINRILNNKPTVPEGVGFKVIIKSTVPSKPGTGYTSPIDFRADYTKAWTGK